MSSNAEYERVSRTKLDIFGADIVTIRGRDAVRSAIESGDLTRMTSEHDALTSLPWFFRWFFPLSRLYSPIHGWFLPFRPESDPSYSPCSSFLRRKFEPAAADMSGPVKRAVDLLADPGRQASDEELNTVFMDAMFVRFIPGQEHVPDNVLDNVRKQVGAIGESFLPHRFLPARGAMREVYAYTEKALNDSGESKGLPKNAVVDVAHALMAPQRNGAKVLRALSADVNDELELEHSLSKLGPVEAVVRAVGRDGTLGGLLPTDQPAVKGKTIVKLDIRIAAAETKQFAWVFGTGDEHRRCAAEPAIREFFQAVWDGLRARRAV